MGGNYPQLWGEYVLVQPLDSGGMGTVFLALESADDHRLCVIKRLNAAMVSDPQRLERFRREADISRTISHSAIARTIRAGDCNGEPFIAQEFVEGKTLSQVVAAAAAVRRQLDPHAVVYVGEKVARALSYAHGARIVHRDIAPSNVMVDFEGNVRLIDFGLARRNADLSLTAAGDFIGRVAYTAPEVLTGTTANPRTDIYSLGVLLWELLVGRPPAFEELKGQPPPSSRVQAPPMHSPFDSTEAMISAVRPVEISRELDQLVVRAIAADPDNRFPSADALGDALHALLPNAYNPKTELAGFLSQCYDVPRERELFRLDIAEARGLLEPSRHPIRGAGHGPAAWKRVATVLGVAGLALGTGALLRIRPPGSAIARRQEVPHLAAAGSAPNTTTPPPPAPLLNAVAPPASVPLRSTSKPVPHENGSDMSSVSHAKRPPSARPPAPLKRLAVAPSIDAGLLLDRARDSLSDHDFDQAARDAKQVIAVGTPRQEAAAHLILGKLLLFRGGGTEAAAAEFATAIELDPENGAAADQLATLRRRGVR